MDLSEENIERVFEILKLAAALQRKGMLLGSSSPLEQSETVYVSRMTGNSEPAATEY